MAISLFANRTPAAIRSGGFRLDLTALSGQACALLDDTGHVVALNDEAAELLGRPKQQMVGTHLGTWEAHQREAAIRIFCPEKAANSTGVMRFLRVTKVVDQTPVSLADAVCLATLEANAGRAAQPFTVAAQGLPEVRVPATWIAAVRCWLNILADLEERGPAQVEVAARFTDQTWMEVELKLRMQENEERPEEFDSTRMDRATLLLRELNGGFELKVDYPLVMVTLWLPLAATGLLKGVVRNEL